MRAEKEKVEVAYQFALNQENIINELRQYIDENLTILLRVVQRERAGVVKTYKPASDQLARGADFDDPFAVFALYNSSVTRSTEPPAHEIELADLRE